MSNDELIDIKAALAGMSGDREIYREVLLVYFEDMPKRITEMLDAYKKKDITTVCRNAHSIKSTSKTIGGMRLGNTAEKLEKEAFNKDDKGVLDLIDRILSEFELLKKTFLKEGYEIYPE